ncbi:MAG: hypothetical protein KBC27_02035 [Rickettsiales bacterium]|nr:hypothetical protein [Rickettsiales bacterium]
MVKLKKECTEAFEYFSVKPGGDVKTLHAAWKTMMRQNHPDLKQDPKVKALAQEKTQEIHEKYTFLTDASNGCISTKSLEDLPKPGFTFGGKVLKSGGKRDKSANDEIKQGVEEVTTEKDSPYGLGDLVHDLFWGGVMGYDLQNNDEQ